MPIEHDMPAAWQAQAARNHSPEVADAIATRAREQAEATAREAAAHGDAAAHGAVTGAPAGASAGASAAEDSALDELSRRRVARFAALEARRLTMKPPPGPPLPPAAC